MVSWWRTIFPLLKVFNEFYFFVVNTAFWILNKFFPKVVLERPQDDLLLLSATELAEMIREGRIKGCRFHFGHALLKRLKKMGLLTEYLQRGDLYSLIRPLFMLPFVPSDRIFYCFLRCRRELLTSRPELAEFTRYMSKVWIGKFNRTGRWIKPRYDNSLWNVYELILAGLPTTNNSIESLHRVFKDSLSMTHPPVTSTDVIDAYIRRIEYVNKYINAVVIKNFDTALEVARRVDEYIQSLDKNSDEFKQLPETKPILGVPFTVKDCIAVEGFVCTVGIPYRRNSIATDDAVVIQRMMNAGGILLAVTNVPELCMWWESYNSIYGRTNNPYDTRRIVGGSSGGEGALLAAGGSVIGIGSDIGGSIRMPAIFNGVFGLKPTPDIIPLEGHFPVVKTGYRTKMLCIGPMCRYAVDLKLFTKILADEESETILRLSQPVNLKKLRLFYMESLNSLFVENAHPEVIQTLKKAVKFFEKKFDMTSYRVDLPLAHYAMPYWTTSMDDEDSPPFYRIMSDFDNPHNVNCWLELGKWFVGQSGHTLPALILGLISHRTQIRGETRNFIESKRDQLRREVIDLLRDDGILVFPSFSTVAPYHNQPLLKPFNFMYTALWNALALPTITVPMGLNEEGIPLSVQLVGAPNSDNMLIAAANELEQGFGGWVPTGQK